VGVVVFGRHGDCARYALRRAALMDMHEARIAADAALGGVQPELIGVWQRWFEGETCLNMTIDRKERARVGDRGGDHHRCRSDGG
jgi:hypothetical protein